MKTNDLIERLATDLRPVRPLSRPGRRAALWWLGGVVYVLAIVAAMTGGALQPGAAELRAWLPQAAAIVGSLLAARAAFLSVIPGRTGTPLGALALAALLWLGSLVATSAWQAPVAAIAAARHEWICVALIVIGGAPLMAVLAVMLRRGAPLAPAATGALVALAVGTLANVGACWSLPHASNEITLVWHGGTVLALVLVAALAGRAFFRWRVHAR